MAKYRAIKPAIVVKGVADQATLHLLRLLSLFDAKAKKDLLQIGKYSAVLWEGKLQSIKDMFAFPGNDASGAELYVKLDPEVRSSLLPCLYFRNKKGMLLGLASRFHPDFVILISVPENAGSKPLFAFLPFRPFPVKERPQFGDRQRVSSDVLFPVVPGSFVWFRLSCLFPGAYGADICIY